MTKKDNRNVGLLFWILLIFGANIYRRQCKQLHLGSHAMPPQTLPLKSCTSTPSIDKHTNTASETRTTPFQARRFPHSMSACRSACPCVSSDSTSCCRSLFRASPSQAQVSTVSQTLGTVLRPTLSWRRALASAAPRSRGIPQPKPLCGRVAREPIEGNGTEQRWNKGELLLLAGTVGGRGTVRFVPGFVCAFFSGNPDSWPWGPGGWVSESLFSSVQLYRAVRVLLLGSTPTH